MSGIHRLVERLDSGEGSAGRLLTDDAFLRRLESAAARFDDLAGRLERGEGSAGRLIHNPELYENMNATLNDVRALVGDVRKDPRKYLRLKLSLF